jgi:hypothetical protein
MQWRAGPEKQMKTNNMWLCGLDPFTEPNAEGDWHCHFLIGAKGLEPVTPTQLAQALQECWTEQLQQGVAEIEPFDPNRQLERVSYVCKVIRDETGNEIDMPFAFSKTLERIVKSERVEIPTP